MTAFAQPYGYSIIILPKGYKLKLKDITQTLEKESIVITKDDLQKLIDFKQDDKKM